MNTYHIVYENGNIDQFQIDANTIDEVAIKKGAASAADFKAKFKGTIIAGAVPDGLD